jgi:ubiquinol-cytochrome c reductase cytochrome b subunit
MAEMQTAPAGAGAGKRLLTWVDNRFPLSKLYNEHMAQYYAPKNFNFWYVFGSLALLVLVMQILTGIFLTMHYKPDAAKAFESVEYIMRDVPWGWLVRYMHSTGASAFFIVVYLHMFRGLIYGSYRKPRELVWLFGCAIFLCLMAEAFMGYLLPWGQMSYWGAQVIVNLFSAVPVHRPRPVAPDPRRLRRRRRDAEPLLQLPRHRRAAGAARLVAAHLIALHEVGSNNPDGVEIKDSKDARGNPVDGIPFHPYYTVHDIYAVSVFLFIFSLVLFFAPEGGGYFLEFNNFIEANPLKTPAHIAPVWYFTPYYSMLRATTDLMVYIFMAIVAIAAVLAILRGGFRAGGKIASPSPRWSSCSCSRASTPSSGASSSWARGADPVRAALARPQPGQVDPLPARLAQVRLRRLRDLLPRPRLPRLAAAVDGGNYVSQIGTLVYFGFFLLMPWWSRIGTFKPVPNRVTFQSH